MISRGRIFICYRREGGAEMARLVHDSLRERGFEVFMDVEDMKSGQFNESLLREIESATDVVVILSPGSLERCFQEGDWLRWEISHAILCEKNVVPVVTRGFTWPTQPLPEELKKLPYYQGVEPSHSLFKASIDKLVELLKARPAPRVSPQTLVAAVAIIIALAAVLVAVMMSHRPGQRADSGALPPEKPDRQGWIPLFDGSTLSGWTAPNGGNWEMKDGELTAKGRSSLFSPYSYTNLEFKAEVRLNHDGNSGMFFRAALGSAPKGYEAECLNSANVYGHTGSLVGFFPFPEQLVADDTWWTNWVVVIGNRIIIRVNDRVVTDFIDSKNTYLAGRLAFEQSGDGTVVTFRNVEAKRLPDDEGKAWTIVKKDMPDVPSNAELAGHAKKGAVLDFDFAEAESGGKVTDKSGSGNHGQVIGAHWTESGKRGGAYQFDADPSYIRVPNNESLNPREMTLSAWMKTSFAANIQRRIFDKGATAGFALNVYPGTAPPNKDLTGQAFFNFRGTPIFSHTRVDDGRWHLLTATYDGSLQRLYMDATLMTTSIAAKGSISRNDLELTIGTSRSGPEGQQGPGSVFNGTIDEVLMLNRAMSPAEITTLYESEK